MALDSTSGKYPGITSPISLDGPKPVDMKLSAKLEETMRPFGVFESDEELAHRYSEQEETFYVLNIQNKILIYFSN